ncbi:MAG: hypothetical protein JHC28_02240, partial [Thermoprotei archaeon]|nr:hypothetical protein [Thermoprotei archaeon]
MKYTNKIGMILLALLSVILITGVATTAQSGAAQIISASGTASDGSAYPGEPITVNIQVNLAGGYTVELAADSAGSTVWATQTFNAPSIGAYTITLTLPKSLPNLTSSPTVYILLSGPFTTDSKTLKIYPKIEISPIQTFVVDNQGNPKTATVYVYGADPGATISSFVFTGPITDTYMLSTPITIASDGTGSATLTLSGSSTGFSSQYGLPRGTYSVTFGSTSGLTYSSNAKPGTLKILPVLLISPDNGNGIDSDLVNINLTGYSFDPNVAIAGVNFTNTNFTNVYYYFDFTTLSTPVTTDGVGHWTFLNLGQVFMTNMTAGLYTLSVIETPTTKTETASNTTVPFGTDTLT